MAYCLKNIKRCACCSRPFDGSESLEQHLQEVRGDKLESFLNWLETSDLAALTEADKHLDPTEPLSNHFDKLSTPDNNKLRNSLAHCAVDSNSENKLQMMTLLIQLHQTKSAEMDFNAQNLNGDTPLHLVCRRWQPSEEHKIVDLAKYLVLKCRTSFTIKNNIGDTPMQIAQRSQAHSLVIIFNEVSD
mmetsp:Transcript_11047/g.16783  ORF Transcript_11047/g.16783 Transcript_11047/m.16783 type:complete len:188 (+) Transcript_11047:475-1038(+)|eukprot:CAMPEP_0170496542 /NCGR_PEP_ID=MMETSP0208-20121228/22033_1 /TAXON_ID=197538 /ORGANISM="Strombidium inclinatum, Strain S3" /LENGTH=187 /DNA_ID=CAMNT_0010773123 /DNA_START=426 /DNA_END=989 /DNA_ORIENTATION=+